MALEHQVVVSTPGDDGVHESASLCKTIEFFPYFLISFLSFEIMNLNNEFDIKYQKSCKA